MLVEGQFFANTDFSSRADEAVPFVWVFADLVGEEDFNASAKKLSRGGVLWAEGLGSFATAAAVEASWEYAGIVEDQEIVGAQEVGEIAKRAILPGFVFAKQMQEAGRSAVG